MSEPQSCTSRTDSYALFDVEIELVTGEKINLRSDSNCFGNIPWNVEWRNGVYSQYSGEIPNALFQLLYDLDGERWKRQAAQKYFFIMLVDYMRLPRWLAM